MRLTLLVQFFPVDFVPDIHGLRGTRRLHSTSIKRFLRNRYHVPRTGQQPGTTVIDSGAQRCLLEQGTTIPNST